jgi:outer membrane protein OmpA-like peptidoglycan-associated protein
MAFIAGTLAYAQPKSFSVDETPFSSSINDEFAPVYYQNGLLYCSNALSNASIQSDEGKLFNMVYVQSKDSGSFKGSVVFSKELTTILNEGPATFTPEGTTIYYARNNLIEGKFKEINSPSNTMGLFSATLTDGIWSEIKAFPLNNQDYSLGTPALSPDGKRLFFASDMPGGFGGTDIYYSDLIDGVWQQPVNLGANINTSGNESYPFMSAAGQLFFASDGLGGFGGKDIFYTAAHNNNWQPPIHLDADINSAHDDYGLITDVNFETGYFSSNRKHSADIYTFKSELPQFGYCDTIYPVSQCYEFYDDRFTDTLHLDYKWNFGKGVVKQGYKVKHCYTQPGDYEVILTIVHNLADSVYSTKAVHRFTIENKQAVAIQVDTMSVVSENLSLRAYLDGFKEFEIDKTYWNVNGLYQEGGLQAEHRYKNAGIKKITIGILGVKDSYGRIPRKCFTTGVEIVNDYQELAQRVMNTAGITYRNPATVTNKNSELYKLDFSVLSSNLSLFDIDRLEDSLTAYLDMQLALTDNTLNPEGINTLKRISGLMMQFPDEKLLVAVHKNDKGSTKAIQQSTDDLANNLRQCLIENGFLYDRIVCKGYGKSRPLIGHREENARSVNQRIEFIIYSAKAESKETGEISKSSGEE